jgi:hypothetical protein
MVIITPCSSIKSLPVCVSDYVWYGASISVTRGFQVLTHPYLCTYLDSVVGIAIYVCNRLRGGSGGESLLVTIRRTRAIGRVSANKICSTWT